MKNRILLAVSFVALAILTLSHTVFVRATFANTLLLETAELVQERQGEGGSQAREQQTVRWSVESKKLSDTVYELIFTGEIAKGWHVYDSKNEYSPTAITLADSNDYVSAGELSELSKAREYDSEKVFFDKIVLSQKIELKDKLSKNTDKAVTIKGTITWRACTESSCASPEDWDFEVNLNAATTTDMVVTGTAGSNSGNKLSIWALIIEAILWGFAMLLTPCVFPMVPMTVSFFIKGSESKIRGRVNAILYGFFIVLLYTLPISIIIIITRFLGGDAVMADIFNYLSTHWLPNIIFFIVFMLFAASFFGAFEITLPSSLLNSSDKKSNQSGIVGIFFMALTLVLVSFSCTGPIVGTVLIKSTQGEFWSPIVTMLAFSIAFALPFTILALFPSLLKNLPKSGSWLSSVKIVLGFIELALGLKFLSVADQTYHWGILDREVYLAIWIVVFSLLGLYLIGKLHFAYEGEEAERKKGIGVLRLAMAIASFSFVIYLLPGMWGAPLKGLSGYLPPISGQDFVLSGNNASNYLPMLGSSSTQDVRQLADETGGQLGSNNTQNNKYKLKLPLGLHGYFTIEEVLKAASVSGKPVFVDITGHGCVNCREMEQRVWTDPRVFRLLSQEYEIVALYTDDKTKLEEKDWLRTSKGKVLKDLGRKNAYIARERFNVNAQPNYALLSSDGKLLLPVRGYNLDIESFVDFLEKGLKLNKL